MLQKQLPVNYPMFDFELSITGFQFQTINLQLSCLLYPTPRTKSFKTP